MALVVVHGEYDETIRFKLYDVTNAMVVGPSEEQLRYVNTESIYTVNVNEGIRSECDQIIQWVSAGEYDKIEAMIERNKNDNLALLEKKKK